MSAVESKLLLDISQYQLQAAAAQGEAKRLREKLEDMSRKGGSAIDSTTAAMKRLEMSGQRTQALFAAKTANPWAANAQAAAQYAQIVESKVVTAIQHASAAQEAAASKAMKAQFLGGSMGGAFDTNSMHAMQAQRSRAEAGVSGLSSGRRGGSKGAGGNYQLGGMAMQFQDIAVQAQMGTRASIILAQQGSQLLSSFGVGGAIAGGVVAIGGAFATMAIKSNESFHQSIRDAAAFQEKMKLVKAEISSSNLGSGLSVVQDQMAKIREEAANTDSFVGEFMTNLGRAARMVHIPGFSNAKSANEKNRINTDIGIAAEKARKEIIDGALASSAKETEILRLRAQLRNDEADAMERQEKIAVRKAQIEALDIPQRAKDQLIGDFRSKVESEAAASKATTAAADEKRDRETAVSLEKKLHEEKLKVLDPAERYLELSKQQESVFATMATQGGSFYQQSIAGLEAWAEANKKAGDTSGRLKVLKLVEQASDLEQQMAAASKEARENTKQSDEKRDKDKKDVDQATEAKQVLDLEMKIAREKQASGKDDTAKIAAFKDQLNTLQLTSQIEDRLHLQHSQALKMAKEKVSAERAATDAIQAQVKAEEAKKTLRSRQELAAEMRVEKMRADGDLKGADAQEERIKLVREAQRIEEETHLGEAKSMALARERIANREKEEKRANRERRLSGDGEDSRPRISAHISGTQDEIRARNNARSLEGWTHPGARDRDAWTPSRMSEQSWGNTGSSLKTPDPMAGMAEANAAKDATVPKTVTFGSREFETLTAIKAGIEKLLE